MHKDNRNFLHSAPYSNRSPDGYPQNIMFGRLALARGTDDVSDEIHANYCIINPAFTPILDYITVVFKEVVPTDPRGPRYHFGGPRKIKVYLGVPEQHQLQDKHKTLKFWLIFTIVESIINKTDLWKLCFQRQTYAYYPRTIWRVSYRPVRKRYLC